MGSERTGPGTKFSPALTPEQIAARMEALARGNKIAAAKRKDRENMAQLAVDIAGLPLDELVKKTATRYRMIAIWHLLGLPNTLIARAIGYATGDVVRRALLRPDVQRLIDEITQAQLKRVIDGEFGVQAAAKAAAPKIMKRIIEKAGGVEDRKGQPVGMAKRDADAIRAAETSLRVSGDLTERRENVNILMIHEMSPEERRRFADHGVWPERFRHIADNLGIEDTPDAIEVQP